MTSRHWSHFPSPERGVNEATIFYQLENWSSIGRSQSTRELIYHYLCSIATAWLFLCLEYCIPNTLNKILLKIKFSFNVKLRVPEYFTILKVEVVQNACFMFGGRLMWKHTALCCLYLYNLNALVWGVIIVVLKNDVEKLWAEFL